MYITDDVKKILQRSHKGVFKEKLTVYQWAKKSFLAELTVENDIC